MSGQQRAARRTPTIAAHSLHGLLPSVSDALRATPAVAETTFLVPRFVVARFAVAACFGGAARFAVAVRFEVARLGVPSFGAASNVPLIQMLPLPACFSSLGATPVRRLSTQPLQASFSFSEALFQVSFSSFLDSFTENG